MSLCKHDIYICTTDCVLSTGSFKVGDKIEILDYDILNDFLTFAGPTGYHSERSCDIFKFFNLYKKDSRGIDLLGNLKQKAAPKKLEMFEKPKQVESVQQQKNNPYDTPTAIDLDHEDYDYHGQLNALINKGGT
jgi:hypothetical protein